MDNSVLIHAVVYTAGTATAGLRARRPHGGAARRQQAEAFVVARTAALRIRRPVAHQLPQRRALQSALPTKLRQLPLQRLHNLSLVAAPAALQASVGKAGCGAGGEELSAVGAPAGKQRRQPVSRRGQESCTGRQRSPVASSAANRPVPLCYAVARLTKVLPLPLLLLRLLHSQAAGAPNLVHARRKQAAQACVYVGRGYVWGSAGPTLASGTWQRIRQE